MSEAQATQTIPEQARPLRRAQSTHPMNSSRLLLDLLALAKNGDSGDGWDSVIQRPAMRSLMLDLQ